MNIFRKYKLLFTMLILLAFCSPVLYADAGIGNLSGELKTIWIAIQPLIIFILVVIFVYTILSYIFDPQSGRGKLAGIVVAIAVYLVLFEFILPKLVDGFKGVSNYF